MRIRERLPSCIRTLDSLIHPSFDLKRIQYAYGVALFEFVRVNCLLRLPQCAISNILWRRKSVYYRSL
uniref:Uncharacterized protein n=1 Tax=Hyaloperonospora arabidopsidis (strain Emoy2) TaxID=559515 RepID=M4BDL9_HYAAE